MGDEHDRIKSMLDDREHTINGKPEIANLSLSTQDRLDLCETIVQMLESGEDNRQVATKVVGIINEFVEWKMKLVKDRQSGKSPIFRRVDD